MPDQIQFIDLDTTIAALQQDPTTIPASDAIAMIDAWQQQLQGSDIAEDLGELKQALQSGNSESISKILTDLGEDTRGVSGEFSADASAKVQQLGTLLEQFGRDSK